MAATRELPLREQAKVDGGQAGPVKFGHGVRDEHFLFDPSFRNLNHGSFGTIPRAIQAKMREYQDFAEARPDPFIRYEYPRLLDESRAAVAELLSVPVDTCVFVPNASVGVNTVLRNLVWDEDARDEILYFSTIYGGCAKTIDSVVEDRRGAVASRCIDLSYPCEDDAVVAAFHAAVDASTHDGKRPRVCLFDVVSSLPGVRFPFEALTAACRERGLLSLVDGAQGIGMVDLAGLAAVDPDFFVSNCHKWLHVPRGCAVLYVPLRNQALIRTTFPTSHGFVPRAGGNRFNPLPPSSKSEFVNNFEFVGSIDSSPYLCVKDSIQWRREILGGEERIREELIAMAREGGRRAAEILGTTVMDNSSRTLTNCAMVNVGLPLALQPEEGGISGDLAGLPCFPKSDLLPVTFWILQKLMDDHNTFVALFVHGGRWWARISAQVYLELDDFEWAARVLKDLCERAAKGEYKNY